MFFKDTVFAQNMEIVKWYLFGIKNYSAISDSRLKKNPQLNQHFGAFAGDRPSVSTKLLLFVIKYYSCRTLQLYYFSDGQLVKLHLLLNIVTKFFRKNCCYGYLFGSHRSLLFEPS